MIAAVIASFASLPERTRIIFALAVATLVGSLVFYMHTRFGHGDIQLYHRYALEFWAGSHFLRALPAEYPLLSLIPFSLTVLPPLPDYVSVFALWMLALMLVGLLAMARQESTRAAEICCVYLTLGGLATVLGRFDLMPAAATVLAYWAARGRRFTLAYTLLAGGTLLKLYPVVLLPILVLEHYRSLDRDPLRTAPPRPVLKGVGVFAAAVVAGFAIALALNPGGWLGPFTYNSTRPLQVESVPASVLWLSSLFGFSITPDHSFHSYNLVGQVDRGISLLSQVAMIGGCAWIYWQQLNGRLGVARALALALLVIICTNRVFSPQYLIWVVPFIAITERDYDGIWLAVCGLTTAIFPFAYDLANLYGPGTPSSYPFFFLGLIAFRNALLVVATVMFLQRSIDVARTEPRSIPQSSAA